MTDKGALVGVEDQNLNTDADSAENENLAEQQAEVTESVEAPAQDGEAAPGETGDINWQAKAEALADEVATLKDQAVRIQAEMQNLRRRAEMDVEKAHKFGVEKFAKELLPVIDSLEKTIEAEKESGNETGPLREGVEMTLSMLLGGIKKFQLEQVDPVGEPFDPALHEAMSMVDSPDAESNTVIAAMQKGYTLSGRLIRPAMVMVAK